MKKLIAITIAAAMLLMAGCSGNGPSSQAAESSGSVSESAAESPASSGQPEVSEPSEAPEESGASSAADASGEPEAAEPSAGLTGQIAEVMENVTDIKNIWVGGGLPVQDVECETDENYQCFIPVKDGRFTDVASLRAYTETAFTAEYAQEAFYSFGLDRNPGARYKDADGVLMEDVGQGGGLSQEWNLSSIVITEETDEGCTAEIDYINYDSTYTSVITFVRTDAGLRINSMEDKD